MEGVSILKDKAIFLVLLILRISKFVDSRGEDIA